MANPELVSYLQEQTQEGVPADVLRQALMETGWKELDIENALHDVAAGLVPLTDGVSLHEDVSQVRTMVAHLAQRVKTIEVHLASAGALPVQGELPAGGGIPSHTLTSRRTNPAISLLAAFLGLMLFAWLGWYGSVLTARGALSPGDQFTIAVGAGVLLLVSGYITMRRHQAWIASGTTAASIALLGLSTYEAWYSYHVIEWTTALALGVLLAVIVLVMGRWIDRLS